MCNYWSRSIPASRLKETSPRIEISMKQSRNAGIEQEKKQIAMEVLDVAHCEIQT